MDFNEKLKIIQDFTSRIQSTYSNKWLGTIIRKLPTDVFVYQEILWDCKPDTIVELGSQYGGSALFMATICEAMGQGEIISVDIENYSKPNHKRITWILGDTRRQETFNKIKEKCKGKVMVILDTDHTKEQVERELELYHPLVSKGQYLVVEDTHYKPNDGGAHDAVKEFLSKHPEFVIDNTREKFIVSFNPDGFLKRI